MEIFINIIFGAIFFFIILGIVCSITNEQNKKDPDPPGFRWGD